MGKKKHRMTQRAALKEIRGLGLTANVIDKEYRIDFRQHDPRFHPGDTGSKAFTYDPVEAVATAREMAKVRAINGRRHDDPQAPTTTTD